MYSVFSRYEKFQYLLLSLVWIMVNIVFWNWWLSSDNIGNPVLFYLMCAAFVYNSTILPSIYLFYLGQMKAPKLVSSDAKPKNLGKIAMITLTVPGSESLDIVERQLVAMKQVKFPHDSWILVDKEHSSEIEKMAKKHKVKYFCRHDVNKWGQDKVNHWNQTVPPFQTKTKAGNVNAWLDQFGDDYSHFTQLDIDHNPIPEYLDEVLVHFTDPAVAWVQAPSVYSNFQHWTARGSAEQELVLQGPLQMGFYGFCQTPFIIGSHATYDMVAIKKIGGFQPTRAEDHLDTVILASIGKKGVFLPKIIATGDGPENFEMYLKQQFAWAYSMIQVLFNYTPKLINNYKPKQALQFLFVQTWYPIWGISMVILFLLPSLSLIFNSPISNVGYFEFLRYFLPLSLTGFAVWIWSKKWQMPSGLGLSWRGIVLHAARWIVVLQALVQVILKIKKPYMITVKGLKNSHEHPFSLWPLAPYFFFSAIGIISCWLYLNISIQGPTQGYLLYALESVAYLLTICFIALSIDISKLRKSGVNLRQILSIRKLPIVVVMVFWFTWFSTLGASAEKIKDSIFAPEELKTQNTANIPEETQINSVKDGIQTPNAEASIIETNPTQSKGEFEYVVKTGDSLWSISKQLYGHGKYWRLIMFSNYMESPQITPGEILIIPSE